MNQSLLLNSSINFDNATFIDNIRQTFIDLQADSINKDEVQEYLQDSLAYLKDPIQDEIANELFQDILTCFKRFTKFFLPFFVDLLKNSKINSNYIIITSFVLSYLTHVQPPLKLPEYQSFVDEALTEILPQIQKENEDDLTIFGHKISPLFKFDLIINLLLSSNKKGRLISKFIPLITTPNLFENSQCLHQLFEEVSNNGLIQILPQTEESIDELYEFIKKQDIRLISQMNEASLSLIEFTLNFIFNQKLIEKVGESDFLPFLAVLFIMLQKWEPNKKFNKAFGSNSIVKLIKPGVETVTSKLTSLSIDFIVSNYKLFVDYEFVKYEEMLQLISFLLHRMFKGNYHGSNMILLFATFDISHHLQAFEIKNFFNKEENKLFEYIFGHLREINDYEKYKETLPFLHHSLNLKYIDSACITSIFWDLQKEEIIQGLHFINNFLIQKLDLECIQNIEDLLLQVLQTSVKDKNWEQLLYVVRFMEENQISENIEILQKMEIPEEIKIKIFRSTVKENISIDDLITYILCYPHPEDNELIFEFLFNKMMEDKEICLSYLCYIFSKNYENAYSVKKFLTNFLDEYKNYKEVFVDAVNQRFYFNKENMLLIIKPNFRLSSLPISDFGVSIILRLYNEVDRNPENFQAFVILKNIASSFPFLFLKNPQQVFDVVSPHLNNIKLIYEKRIDENQIRMIKTSFSALMFLYNTLQNTKIFDLFIKFVFTNISTFTNQQILCFFFIIYGTFNSHLSLTNISVWFHKYNVFEIIGDLLNKIDPNDPISYDFQNVINILLTYVFKKTDYTEYEIIQKEEFINLEFPLNYAFEFSFTTFIHGLREVHLIFKQKHEKLDSFIVNIQSKRKFYLSYDLSNRRKQPPETAQIIDFIKKLKSDYQLIPSYQIPKVPDILTVKMVRYLVMQSGAVYTNILFNDDTPLVKETFDMILNAVEKLNEMNQEGNNDDDDDCDDINSYDEDRFYSRIFNHPSFYKKLIHQLVSINYGSLFYKLFESISAKNNCLGLILDSMSQELKDIYKKRMNEGSDLLNNVIRSLVQIVNKLRGIKSFDNLFFKCFGDTLLDVILTPEIRQDENLLIEVATLFSRIDSVFPIRMTHLIGFLLLQNSSDSVSLAFKLLSKFEYKQFENIKDIIFSVFDNELNKGNMKSDLLLYLKNCPSIVNERSFELLDILTAKLDIFSQSNRHDVDLFELICTLFNILTPVRGKSTNLSSVVEENASDMIPKSVMETSPKFWSVYAKHQNMINEMITNRPLLLDKLGFLLSFPEVVSFKTRSSYFRIKQMEENRSKNRVITLIVNRSNILESSFNSFQQLELKDIINDGFKICFEGEVGIDASGLRREWFTLLSKEIFNQKNALFCCSKKNKCYQPNPLSEVNPEHLKYFRFIGQFVALSLLENTCIDAHFTTSFCRMILHRDPNPKDLENVDEELYKNMEWILDNDVDQLSLYFAIDVDKFGNVKTVPLIENGAEIKVTNDNKKEFVALRSLYILKESIKEQIKAFSDGFDSLLPHNKIRFFTPNELGLLICGLPEIDVQDLEKNIAFGVPYNRNTPVVKLFFKVISKWNNENLVKLLIFITGSSSVPVNGFKEFCEMSGSPITIVPGGDREKLPQARTCFNILRLPEYENEEELNRKLLLAIQQCNTFESS